MGEGSGERAWEFLPAKRNRMPSALRPTKPNARRNAMREAWAVFEKDWRGEWRSRAALNAIALFALATPIALSLGVAGQKLSPQVLAGLLWATPGRRPRDVMVAGEWVVRDGELLTADADGLAAELNSLLAQRS